LKEEKRKQEEESEKIKKKKQQEEESEKIKKKKNLEEKGTEQVNNDKENKHTVTPTPNQEPAINLPLVGAVAVAALAVLAFVGLKYIK